ncbi:hypothetical protein JG687_00017606 [Phytophthora cactorum]|uniref:Uncharacterized protein n=1 Tax=Phytophthora cactorum TaxID=29920 RepID=A0A8T1TPJ8_9STRA|nr:hypothetical protein JG687_00017606 [Phytophthora cactorum]
MIRKRGYSLKGQMIAIRGYFQRKPRGTFDRVEFVKCCSDFASSSRGNLRPYPGSNYVWILDGASIHRHPEIVHFLRSIEFMFGYIKRSFQRHYVETSGSDLLPFVVETFERFEQFNMAKVFEHCGWKIHGHLDPTGPLLRENRKVPDLENSSLQVNYGEEDLGFLARQMNDQES